MIQQYKKEGKIVSSEVTIKLLWNAMQNSKNKKFVIDGFPRNEENRAAFENIVRPKYFTNLSLNFIVLLWIFIWIETILQIQLEPDFVLFFDCPEEELIKRLLNRNQVNFALLFGKKAWMFYLQSMRILCYFVVSSIILSK